MDNNIIKSSYKFNGSKLKSARLYRGLSLTDLGEKIELSKQTLSLYENNKRIPDFSTIIKLANTLHFPNKYFFGEEKKNIYYSSTYFRSFASTSKKSRTMEILKVEYISELYKALYDLVEFPRLNIPNIDIKKKIIDDEYIDKLALELRKYWNLGTKPIDDLQYTLEENGLLIVGSYLDDRKIDAFSKRIEFNKNETFIIVLSIGQKPKSRINFDLAHELGHIMLHPWTENLESLSHDEFKERERQANKFASSFLLPKDSFKKECEKNPKDLNYYIMLKNVWHCSIQAMIYRANDLGLISNNQFQYLLRKINKNGWRTNEPLDFPHELNETVFKGAIDLLFDNSYTKQQILDLFNELSISLYSDEIEELLNLPEGYLKIEEKVKSRVIEFKIKKK